MKKSPPNSCNVLSLASNRRHLWRYATGGGQANLTADQNGTGVAPLPQKIVGKDWRALISQKLNIAWLPLNQVFLRVMQLPKCDFTELLAMLEFQLEKISPLPVAQIVWSAEVIPAHTAAPSELQTVLVIIIARSHVEEFLGQLEGKGYLADQLEIPFLNQLLASKIEGDGAWFYLIPVGDLTLGLAAWWYGGVLQNLDLLHLTTPENFRGEVGEQLTKSAWAGEMEGWMTSPPAWRLVADADIAPAWQKAFEAWSGHPVDVLKALPEPELARLSAQRVARGENRVNLLPSEYSARYRQQLVDRVWMRGLGALLLLYIFGVLGYFVAVNYLVLQRSQLEKELDRIQASYTQAQQIKAKIQVVRTQVELKFAALNVWKAVTGELPEQMVLQSLSFTRGRSLSLSGFAPDGALLTDFNEALIKLRAGDDLLFSSVQVRQNSRGNGIFGPQTTTWTIDCELKAASDTP